MLLAAQDLMGLLTVLLLLAGALGCAFFVKRTRWAGLLAAGFLVHGVGVGFARFLIFMGRHGHPRLGPALLLGQLVAVIGTAMIVVAAVAVLAAWDRRSGTMARGTL